MKKMLALLLTAIMLSALIMSAACTPVEEKPDNTPQPTEAGAQTDEPAGPTAEPTEPITEQVGEGAVEHTITGLDGGVSYEVRIRAYAKAMTIVQIEMDQYGEYSDTMTVAVP